MRLFDVDGRYVSSEFNSKVAWRVKNSLPPFPPFLREERMGIGGGRRE